MTKVTVTKAGISLEVDQTAVDYYLRTGYKVRKAPKPTPPPPAVLKVQLVEPERPRPVQAFEIPEPVTDENGIEQPVLPAKKPRKPRKKKADK